MDFRELNYILIPRSTERVDDWLEGRVGRVLGPFVRIGRSLTREGQVLLVVTAVTAAAGIDVTFSHLYLVFCGLAGLWMAAFLCRPLARLDQVSLQVDRPPRVAAGQGITFSVRIHNRGEAPVYALRVRGPFLPWDGTWLSGRAGVPFLPPGGVAHVELVARLDCRGERYLGRFFTSSVRPLGVLSGPRITGERVRVMVVPRVRSIEGLPLPVAIDEEHSRSRILGSSP